jgi:plasmid stability protein
MKNITISIDDDLYRQARMKAAEQSTSISALFRNFLIRLTTGESAESEFQRLAREEQELRAELHARRLGLKPEHNRSRDELHDPDALR